MHITCGEIEGDALVDTVGRVWAVHHVTRRPVELHARVDVAVMAPYSLIVMDTLIALDPMYCKQTQAYNEKVTIYYEKGKSGSCKFIAT